MPSFLAFAKESSLVTKLAIMLMLRISVHLIVSGALGGIH